MTAKITLTWNNTSNIHKDQLLYKSLTSFTDITLPLYPISVGKSARSYIDNGVTTGLTYYYAVGTEDVDGNILLSSVISVVAESSGGGDPYWANVVSLLHFDGDFTDQTGKTWTNRGGSSIDTSTSPFGVSSLLIPASSRAGLYHVNSSDFALSGVDFTVELFVLTHAATGSWFVEIGTGVTSGWFGRLWIDIDDGLMRVAGGPSAETFIKSGTITTGVWTHIAITVASGTLRSFIDGQMKGSASIAWKIPTGDLAVGLGHILPGTHSTPKLNIDEVRITKGVARYTENFTPPTEPFPNF